MHGVHASPAAPAQHGDLGCNGSRKSRQSGLGLAFLQVADHRIDHHDTEDDGAVDPFAQGRGDDPGTDQNQYQRLFQLAQEARQRAASGVFAELVGAMAPQSRRRLLFR